MFQAFMVVLREGVEAFLIVAIIFAYLRKRGEKQLMNAVSWGVAASALASGLLGYALWITQGASAPLWEGVFASVTVVLVTTLLIHMWKVGPHLKTEMEKGLSEAASKQTASASYWGVFLFAVVSITREGMEMMLLLFQIQEPHIVAGILLGVLGAAAIALLWQQFGYLINFRRFFQITAIYLLLFTFQIAFQAFHEFTEAGIFPHSEALHAWSEPYSTQGVYGKWYANILFAGCAAWLLASLLLESKSRKPALD